MEGNATSAVATEASNPQGPESGNGQEKPATSSKVLFDGQEMEVDSFLKTRKHKVKVDGQELEVDHEELLRGYGHTKAANQRMQEAAEARKRAESAEAREKALFDSIHSWKENPSKAMEALEKLGIDVDSLSHDRVMRKLKYEMMSDEERAGYERDQKLASYEQREKAEAEAKRQAEIENLRQQSVTELETNIIGYLEKSKTPISPAIIGRALDNMLAAYDTGTNLPIEKAFEMANGWYQKESRSIFDYELKALLQSNQLPKELVEEVRKRDIASVRQAPPKRETAPDQRSNAGNQKSQGMSLDDFFNSNDKRYTK